MCYLVLVILIPHHFSVYTVFPVPAHCVLVGYLFHSITIVPVPHCICLLPLPVHTYTSFGFYLHPRFFFTVLYKIQVLGQYSYFVLYTRCFAALYYYPCYYYHPHTPYTAVILLTVLLPAVVVLPYHTTYPLYCCALLLYIPYTYPSQVPS